MNAKLLSAWQSVQRPIIGMLHAPPLPGAPAYDGQAAVIEERVLRDAEALVGGGVHGLMLENFGDTPFYPQRVPAAVVAWITRLAGRVRDRFDVPLGVNVLRNDGRSALAAAHASGAAFIRVNVLCGARVTDQGLLQGIAHDLLRDRAQLGANRIRIFADVNVKHSAPAGMPRPLAVEVRDLTARGGADALIVSGTGTGAAVDANELAEVKAAAGTTPVFVGSGVSSEQIDDLLPHADGFIVGTSLKVEGVTTNPVDPQRVRALVLKVAANIPASA